jgi:hypothetical protein
MCIQKLVNLFLKRGKRERPTQEFDGFDLRSVCLRISEEEGRGACHAGLYALLEAGIDQRSVFAVVQAA